MDTRFGLSLIIQRSRADRPRAAAFITAAALVSWVLAACPGLAAPVQGWLSWRGPEQTGVSHETGLPEKISAQEALWVADFPGQSAPVVANSRLYAMGNQRPRAPPGPRPFRA